MITCWKKIKVPINFDIIAGLIIIKKKKQGKREIRSRQTSEDQKMNLKKSAGVLFLPWLSLTEPGTYERASMKQNNIRSEKSKQQDQKKSGALMIKQDEISKIFL